ncbi:MAG: ABC-2 family transporter protein [Candidatus Shapirobacteria bacterium]
MLKELRKAWAYLVIGWQDAVTYRTEAFLWVIMDSIPVLSVIFVWQAIYQNKTSIAGISLAQMVTYYFIMIFTDSATGAHFDTWLINYIKDGELASQLTKPISIFTRFSIEELSYKLIRNPLAFLFSVLVLFLISGFMPLSQVSFKNLPLYLIFVFLGFCLSVMINFITSAFAFWLQEATSLINLRWWTGALFSGQMFPLFIMPQKMQALAGFLPFKYLIYVPIQILTGELKNCRAELMGVVFWLFFYGKGD